MLGEGCDLWPSASWTTVDWHLNGVIFPLVTCFSPVFRIPALTLRSVSSNSPCRTPRDAPTLVRPYQIAEFLIEEILQCPRMAPTQSPATAMDHDVQYLDIWKTIVGIQ